MDIDKKKKKQLNILRNTDKFFKNDLIKRVNSIGFSTRLEDLGSLIKLNNNQFICENGL